MKPTTICLILDTIISLLMVISMLVNLTGETLHELFGALFFVGVITHLVFSFTWIRHSATAASKGTLKKRTKRLSIMALLLALTGVVLAVSSIAISRVLASIGFGPEMMSSVWIDIHTVSSFTMSALVVIHLVMHWATVFKFFHIPYNPARRRTIERSVQAVGVLGVGALCVYCAKAMRLFPDSKTSNTSNNSNRNSDDSASDTESTESENNNGHGRKKQDKHGAPRDKSNSNESSRDTASSDSEYSKSDTDRNSDSNSGSNTSSGSSSGSSSSGYCTLCSKHCPLSAPKCDRPYREGLL